MLISGPQSTTYRVRSGDTLSAIARSHNTTVDGLVRANNISNPNRIRSGTQLKIPGSTDDFQNAPVPANRANQVQVRSRQGDGFDATTGAVPMPRPAPKRPTQTSMIAPVPRPASERPVSIASNVDGPTPTNLNDTERIAPAKDRPAVQTQTPWISQYDHSQVKDAGHLACFRAATAMARAAGTTVTGVSNRIQIATAEGPEGITVDSQAAQRGRNYIDRELSAGRPVVVGVNHQAEKKVGNEDGITDHFVVVTGRGTDEQGRTYYTFHDPATSNPTKGSDTNPFNRFYINNETGGMYRPGPMSRYVADRGFEVTMIRPNA